MDVSAIWIKSISAVATCASSLCRTCSSKATPLPPIILFHPPLLTLLPAGTHRCSGVATHEAVVLVWPEDARQSAGRGPVAAEEDKQGLGNFYVVSWRWGYEFWQKGDIDLFWTLSLVATRAIARCAAKNVSIVLTATLLCCCILPGPWDVSERLSLRVGWVWPRPNVPKTGSPLRPLDDKTEERPHGSRRNETAGACGCGCCPKSRRSYTKRCESNKKDGRPVPKPTAAPLLRTISRGTMMKPKQVNSRTGVSSTLKPQWQSQRPYGVLAYVLMDKKCNYFSFSRPC